MGNGRPDKPGFSRHGNRMATADSLADLSEKRDAVQTLANQGIYDHGEVAERLNAAVLKTAERDERSVGSNPTLSESL